MTEAERLTVRQCVAYRLAHHAADKSMEEVGRESWNEQDWDVADAEYDRAMLGEPK